jgi:hypothetical protein
MGAEVEVAVGVDHSQFIACDPAAQLDIDSYGDLAQRRGLAMWRGNRGVTIFTASNWTETHVTVRLSSERPTVALDDWDHVVEGGLVISSARLHLYGPEDTGANEAAIGLPSHSYSLIVCGRDFDSANEYGDEGRDTYTLLLWPGPALDGRVLKDGLSSIG